MYLGKNCLAIIDVDAARTYLAGVANASAEATRPACTPPIGLPHRAAYCGPAW